MATVENSSNQRDASSKEGLLTTRTPDTKTPLGRAQKAFHRELQQVEHLRKEYDRVVALWLNFLNDYKTKIHPAELKLTQSKIAIVCRLDEFLRPPNKLGRRQKEYLDEILMEQISDIQRRQPDCLQKEPALARIHERIDQEAKEAMQNCSPEEKELSEELLKKLFTDMGFDTSNFTMGRDVDEMGEDFMEQMRQRQGGSKAAQPDTNASTTQKKSKAEQRAAEVEEARQRSLSSIYKDLAKVLHPDRESDPALRSQKEKVMQELTSAYREKDLHTLLRLELEWLKKEEGHLGTLALDRLKIYTSLLKEQNRSLAAAYNNIPFEPRFSSVSHYSERFAPFPQQSSVLLKYLNLNSLMVSDSLQALNSPTAKEELRELFKAWKSKRSEMFDF